MKVSVKFAPSRDRNRLSKRINGPARRMFRADYTMFRHAGLTRHQAVEICVNRYAKKDS